MARAMSGVSGRAPSERRRAMGKPPAATTATFTAFPTAWARLWAAAMISSATSRVRLLMVFPSVRGSCGFLAGGEGAAQTGDRRVVLAGRLPVHGVRGALDDLQLGAGQKFVGAGDGLDAEDRVLLAGQEGDLHSAGLDLLQ